MQLWPPLPHALTRKGLYTPKPLQETKKAGGGPQRHGGQETSWWPWRRAGACRAYSHVTQQAGT